MTWKRGCARSPKTPSHTILSERLHTTGIAGGLRALFSGVLEQFETFGLTEESVFLATSGAAVKWPGRGRAKNGRSVEFEGIDVFALDPDGRIRSLHAYWDAAPFLAAVGLARARPPDGRHPDRSGQVHMS
jgi:hypothetical protein